MRPIPLYNKKYFCFIYYVEWMNQSKVKIKKTISCEDEYVYNIKCEKQKNFKFILVMSLFVLRHLLLEYKKRYCSHFWDCVVFAYAS
jgi:hypothetical protein